MFKKAFDATWHQGLIYQLYNDGTNSNIVKLVTNSKYNEELEDLLWDLVLC